MWKPQQSTGQPPVAKPTKLIVLMAYIRDDESAGVAKLNRLGASCRQVPTPLQTFVAVFEFSKAAVSFPIGDRGFAPMTVTLQAGTF